MTRPVSARIPDDLYRRLESVSQSLGLTVSDLVRLAIEAYLADNVNSPYTASSPKRVGQGIRKASGLPVNSPYTPVNSAVLSEYLARLDARITALEQAISPGIPRQTAVNSLSTPANRDPDLEGMTVRELRQLAKGSGIPRYWFLSKADLIAALAR